MLRPTEGELLPRGAEEAPRGADARLPEVCEIRCPREALEPPLRLLRPKMVSVIPHIINANAP